MAIRHLTRLDEVFPDAVAGKGIFSYLNNFSPPWKEDTESSVLDLQYHLNRSGEKWCSPVVRKLIGEETVVTSEVGDKLASIIWAVNGVSWRKLYETLSLEYNPIDNYNMVENEDIDSTGSSTSSSLNTRTDNLTKKTVANNTVTDTGTVDTDTDKNNTKTLNLTQTKTGKNKDSQTGTVGVEQTDTGTVKVDGSTSGDNTNNLFGYNSSVAVPSDSGHTSGTSNSTTTNNLSNHKDTDFGIDLDKTIDETVTDKGTDSDAGNEKKLETRDLTQGHKIDETVTDSGTVSQEGSGEETKTGKEIRQLTRKGNIGVTTSQQMIQSERDLWLWKFFEQVFKDIDSILTLSIY